MLARKYRLPILEFKSQKSKLIRPSPYFSVRIRANNVGHNRFAVIISAKRIKKATGRHYFKRRLLDGLGQWSNLKTDFLFIVAVPIENPRQFNFQKELSATLAEAKKQ